MVYFGLDAEEYDRKYSDRELIRRMVPYFRPYARSMGLVILFMAISSVASGLTPFLISRLLAQLGTQYDARALALLVFVTLLLNVSSFVFNYIRQVFGIRVLSKVENDLRHDATKAVLAQDLSFFDKYPSGKVVSRVNSDSYNFGFMSWLTMEAAASIFVIFIILIPIVLINGTLTLVFLMCLPLVFFFTYQFRKKARDKTLKGQRALASVNAFVQETMTGIQIAKTFRQEARLFKDFHRVNEQSYQVNKSRAFYLNYIWPGLNLIQSVVIAALIYVGGSFLTGGLISAADLYLFIRSLGDLFFPIFTVASFWPQFQTGMAAAERIFALMDHPPAVAQTGALVIPEIKGKIEFDNLTFAYKEGKPVFQDFSVSIQPGESVAIVGHTGAGKSSLANLIMRFYEFQGGDIRVDGNSIRDLDLDPYRRQIKMISQTPFLWGATIENNVRYGAPETTREKVTWALEQAGGLDWVEDLPEGLETHIGERGKVISMGQRQLVVFARTFLHDPRILILDEATASVDPFTETRIQDALDHLMGGRTTIVIAHRLWTVRHVDRILVLSHGKIIEEGNHDALIAKGGHYAELYNTYFLHQSFEYVEKMCDLSPEESKSSDMVTDRCD